jgi:uncharacterized protein
LKNNAFILFLRYPELGAIKTRLAETLGDDLTYELYCSFLADISVMVREINAETIIVYSGANGVSFPYFPGIECLHQRGNNIGERMQGAFIDILAKGFERCVLIGSDSPDIPAALVNDAFNKLDSADIILGPSSDGGYYLIGCKRQSVFPSIFDGINWSTSEVFTETIKRITEAGLKFALLQQWSDIDEFDDLKIFYQRNINRSVTSQVMKFLNAKRIINEIKS